MFAEVHPDKVATKGDSPMWHRESVALFLEDQNADPAEIEAMKERAKAVAGPDGCSFDSAQLEHVIGSAELAQKFEQAWARDTARYGAPAFDP